MDKRTLRRRITGIGAVVTAVTLLGLTQLSASAASPRVPVDAKTFIPRAADCPAKGTSVRSASELTQALKTAKAGSVIKLTPGTYKGDFTLNASGTATAPIWLCGPESAVLTNGSVKAGHPLTVKGASYVVATGFSVANAFKGVTVVGGHHVAVTDLKVTDIGYEAIHVRNQAADSAVAFNHISRTGLVEAKYGEGIYTGTSGRNWCKFNDCAPDATTRIVIRGNVISDTGAQPIEVKEGTTGGFIDANTVFGSSRIETYSRELIAVNGNGYQVTKNVVKRPPLYGLSVVVRSDGAYGKDNVFSGNTVVGAPEMGVWIHQPGLNGTNGNVVKCDNSASGAPRLTNTTCVK